MQREEDLCPCAEWHFFIAEHGLPALVGLGGGQRARKPYQLGHRGWVFFFCSLRNEVSCFAPYGLWLRAPALACTSTRCHQRLVTLQGLVSGSPASHRSRSPAEIAQVSVATATPPGRKDVTEARLRCVGSAGPAPNLPAGLPLVGKLGCYRGRPCLGRWVAA